MIWTKKEIGKVRSLRLSLFIDERLEDKKMAESINYEIKRQFKLELPDFQVDVQDILVQIDTSKKALGGNSHVAFWSPNTKVVELLGGVGHEQVYEVQYQGMPVMMKALDEPLGNTLLMANAKYSAGPPMPNTRDITYELYGWSTDRRWIYTERQ